MAAWQSRPLDSVYPVIFIDCVHVKIRVLALILLRGTGSCGVSYR